MDAEQKKKAVDLVVELTHEANMWGYFRGCYSHGGHALHTVRGRQEMLNTEALVKQIRAELIALIEGRAAQPAPTEGE